MDPYATISAGEDWEKVLRDVLVRVKALEGERGKGEEVKNEGGDLDVEMGDGMSEFIVWSWSRLICLGDCSEGARVADRDGKRAQSV